MISNLLSRAADSGPVVHITPLPLFTIGGFTITNSILFGWLACTVLLVVSITIARKVTVKPKGGLIQYFEAGVTFIADLVESSFEERSKGKKYVPYFVTLFFFILINNWLGLVPGVGDGITINGNPLFRPFTGDLNGTLAVGLITMTVVYASSIMEGGVKKYFGHFFVGSPLNPLYFLIGLIEMLTDFTRVLSLSLRLFLNVTIGEIVIAVFSYLGGFVAPITAAPFMAIELFVGALQAYIFTILSVMYLAIAVNHISEHDILTDENIPATMTNDNSLVPLSNGN